MKSTILEIRINYELETGKIAVFAPMNQKEVCFAILKKARKTIRNFKAPVISSRVMDAQGNPAPIKAGVLA